MPKKRNKYWSQNKKQKQLITARLMEISLKVDDYIYNHQPISDRDAELHIQEVSSYKTQCFRDERSLQVIEKLIRCMKAIIIDHQEQRADFCEENNAINLPGGDIRAGSVSPVYSMPDEDRTYLTQPDEGVLNVSDANNDVEIVDLVSSDNDDEINGANTATAVAGSRINVEVDIHRGLSSLSLKDVEPLNTTCTDANCSQSILNNFGGAVEEKQLKNSEAEAVNTTGVSGKVDAETKIDNIIQAGAEIIYNTSIDQLPSTTYNNNKAPIIAPTHTIVPKNKNAINKTRNLIETHCNPKSKLLAVNKEPMKVMNTTNKGPLTTSHENNTSSQEFYSPTNIIYATQRETFYDSNRTCPINDSSPAHIFNGVHQNNINKAKNVPEIKTAILINTFKEIAHEKHSTNATENFTVNINNAKPSINTLNVQENPLTTKKKRAPRKKKVTDVNVIKPINKRPTKRDKENTPNKPKKNRGVPIYNKNVENDLSWVENIRYVREIRDDENDIKLNVEDSFWDNYYLPNNWNENDFMY